MNTIPNSVCHTVSHTVSNAVCNSVSNGVRTHVRTHVQTRPDQTRVLSRSVCGSWLSPIPKKRKQGRIGIEATP